MTQHADSPRTSFRTVRSPHRWALNILMFVAGGLALFWVFAWIFADGRTDGAYMKVASPRAQSLIIGTSRAGQGLQPGFFGKEMFNFGFSIIDSPYGATYHRAIRRKLKKGGDAAFIVEVNPVALSDYEKTEPREDKATLGRIFMVSGHPNLNYLLRCHEGPMWKLALPSEPPEIPFVVHRDGWTELRDPRVPLQPEDRIAGTSEYYRKIFNRARPSSDRLAWLEKTVRMLSGRGRALLVRLPVGEEMRAMETEYWPEFDAAIGEVAERTGVEYVNLIALSRDDWTVDGSHLNREAGARISALLAERLDAPPSGTPQREISRGR